MTTQDAYALGYSEGVEAREERGLGAECEVGMSWGEDLDMNDAYDRGFEDGANDRPFSP